MWCYTGIEALSITTFSIMALKNNDSQHISPIVSYPLNETSCLVNQVYSIIIHSKSSEYLYQIPTGVNRMRSKRKRGKREREQQINGVRDRELNRKRNGVGWKWQLVRKDTLVFKISNQ